MKMNAAEILAFLAVEFPAASRFGNLISVTDDCVVIELPHDDANIRPGGTISGPTMMALADTTAYYLVLAMCGPLALAVTSNLNINFLRRPRPGTLTATARTLKLGRRLVIVEVDITDATAALLAKATVTYALPG